MKKILTLFLALLLTLSVCAAAAEDPEEIPGTVDMPYAGLRFVPPELYRNAKGLTLTDGEIEFVDGIWYAYWLYIGMTEEELEAYINGSDDTAGNRIAILFYVFSIGNGQSFTDFNAMIDYSFDEDHVREIGKVGDNTFYLSMEEPNPDFINAIGPDYAEEYTVLLNAADETAAAFTCYEPEEKPDPYADLIGSKFEFTTTDLDGNTVSSADLFAQHEITMVNIWATWCGPCVGELAELQQIHTRLQGKDCAVVGMLTDNDLDSARQLIADNGVTYPVLIAPDELYDLLELEYIPTTLFVGRDGTVLAYPIVGALVDEYESMVESLLPE